MSTKSKWFTAALALYGGVVCYGQTDQADAKAPANTEMRSAIGKRRLVDKGLEGSATRKEARAFSGEIQKRIGTLPPGLRGSSSMKESKSPDASGATRKMITLGLPAMAEFSASNNSLSAEASARMVPDVRSSSITPEVNDPRALMVSPPYGATLAPIQTFRWTKGSAVVEYYLRIGSCYDCTDLLDENEARNLSRTVNLPADGRIIFLTLFSYINGQWYYVDYQFYAANGAVPAFLTTPNNGDTLNSPQNFAWNPGVNVSDYHMWIGSCYDCTDLLDEDEGLNLTRTIDLPVDGRTVFVTLFSYIDGNWFYIDYQFRAGSGAPVRVWVNNNLGYPVNVFVNGEIVGTADPYSTEYKDVKVVSLRVSFELVQPKLGDRTLGDSMAGYWSVINSPSGEYTFPVTSQIGSDYYFLPEITNQTGVALDIAVNGGLQAENKCNCSAPAFTNNVASGYYQLYSNSNVRLFRDGWNYAGPYIFFGTDANGSQSPGGVLYQYVDANSGVLYLTVTSAP